MELLNKLRGISGEQISEIAPKATPSILPGEVKKTQPVKEQEASEKSNPVLEQEDVKQLRSVVDGMNGIMEQFNRKISFAEYEDTNRWYVKILDSQSQEVIKTIPAEKMLELMQRLDEFIGLFVDEIR